MSNRKYIRLQKIHNDIQKHGHDILNAETFLQAKEHCQHGNVSVWQHSMNVAKMSLRMGKRLPFKVCEKDLVRGALLHDYFQYDWHTRKSEFPRVFKMHGFTHAKRALENAKKDFDLSHIEKDIIGKHMWPLTLRSIPKHRESWIVTLADKYVSLLETIHVLKGDMNNG